MLRTLLDARVTDTHGIKAFRNRVVADLAPLVKSRQDLFDTELVLRAERVGCTITEVPARVEEMRLARSSLIKRVPRTLRGLLRLRRSLPPESVGRQPE